MASTLGRVKLGDTELQSTRAAAITTARGEQVLIIREALQLVRQPDIIWQFDAETGAYNGEMTYRGVSVSVSLSLIKDNYYQKDSHNLIIKTQNGAVFDFYKVPIGKLHSAFRKELKEIYDELGTQHASLIDAIRKEEVGDPKIAEDIKALREFLTIRNES